MQRPFTPLADRASARQDRLLIPSRGRQMTYGPRLASSHMPDISGRDKARLQRRSPGIGYGRSVFGSNPRDRSLSSDCPPPGPIDCPPPGPMDCPPPGPIDSPPPGPIDNPPPGPIDFPPPGPIESQPPGPIEPGMQSRQACAALLDAPTASMNKTRTSMVMRRSMGHLRFPRARL